MSYTQELERNREFSQGRVFCVECQAFKPVEEFYPVKGKGNFGYRFYCKNCEALRTDKTKARSRYLRVRSRNVDKLVELLGGKCQFPGCNYDNPLVLEFHHINPKEKTGSPKGMAYVKSGFNKAVDEANKCCLLCPTHHREIEVGLYQVKFKKIQVGYAISEAIILDDRIIKQNGKVNEQNDITTDQPPVIGYRESITQPELW
jgi:hypothetical protein